MDEHARGRPDRADPTPLTGDRLTLRPWRPDDGPELNRIVRLPEIAHWWAEEDFTADSEEDEQRYVILVEDTIRGMIQYYEENEPRFRHAGMDVFLDPAVRGRGLGVEAIRLLGSWLFTARAHHRLIIDPALANTSAVRAYEKAGFRRVGVLREYWLGPDDVWQDGLLLDLVRGDWAD